MRMLVEAADEGRVCKMVADAGGTVLMSRPSNESFTVKQVIRSWERLRLIYNGVLLLVGVLVAAHVCRVVHAIPEDVRSGGFLSELSLTTIVVSFVFFGLMANCVYLLGPAFEICLTVFLNRKLSRRWRHGLFVAWLFVSIFAICRLHGYALRTIWHTYMSAIY